MLTITPNTPYDVGLLPPTDLKLSTASKGGVFNGGFELGTPDTAVTADGWIVDAKYGWYFDEVATEASAEFDSAIIYKGKQSLLIQAIDATGTGIVYNTQGVTLPILGMEAVPLKVSTTYRLSAWVKTNAGVGASGAYIDIAQYDSAAVVGTTSVSGKLSASQNWTLVSVTFTSDNDVVYGRIGIHNDVAGAVSSAWFDNVTLEEIVTDTTFTGKVAEKIRPVLQAVTSTDNIDQSLDSGGAYANTYALTNAVNEGATHIQTFTPTKKHISQIGVWIVATGTAVDWTLTIHDAANTTIYNKLIAAASLVAGAFNYFDIPALWTTGAYHFHVHASATTGTPTLKANTSNDLETASYIQRYCKPTEGFAITCNGIETKLKADKDGLLSGAVIDLDNGKYTYGSSNFHTKVIATDIIKDIYESTNLDWTYNTFNRMLIGTGKYTTFKVNTLLPIKHLVINGKPWGNSYLPSANNTIKVSADNVNWVTLESNLINAGVITLPREDIDIFNGLSTFYIRYSSETGNYWSQLDIEADLDTSSIPTGLFYPLSTNQFTETYKVMYPDVSVNRIYFQSAKYTNEYGVVVPALEFYSTVTSTVVGYIQLKIDNSQEASPCVSVLSTTTNYQQSGTGSNVTGGVVLNTDEYVTLTSAVAELKVDYQVGTGTTAIAAITKNTMYLSSNGEGNDSTQDPSHQFNAILGVRQEGLIQRVSDIGNEVAEVKKPPTLEFNEIWGSGTSYTLTTSLAVIAFGTSGNLETTLPNIGIYEVTAEICDNLSAVTASAAANYSLFQLYKDSVAETNGERVGLSIPIIVAAVVGTNIETHTFKWIVRSYRTGTLISVYGKENSAVTGTWTIDSAATGRTRLNYKRIA